MKIEISLDHTCKEPKVIIATDKITDEVTKIINRLSETYSESLTAFSENGVQFIDYKDTIRFFSENQKVFVQTPKGIYTVRARLYELEQTLDSKLFLRISNSEIINVKKIRNMDTSLTGTICVHLHGGIKTYVSRRYVPRIKQFFGI